MVPSAASKRYNASHMSLHDRIRNKYHSVLDKGTNLIKKHVLHEEPLTIKRAITLTFTLAATLFITGVFLFFVAITVFSLGLPNIENIDRIAISTEIFDRNGIPLYTIHGEENREYVPYEKISPNIINATIAIEDSEFWDHHGFDLGGIAKGVLSEFFRIGKRRGGSTITQQYAKNAFLTPERSLIRKIRELILAVKLEQKYEKKKILELYLNEIPYGNNAYGVEKAAQIYFGKSATDLTMAQGAILAAIPQAPSYYNPYGNNSHSSVTKTFTPEEIKDRNIQKEEDLNSDEYSRGLIGKTATLDENHKIYIAGRTDTVLKRMMELGMITENEKQEAWEETQRIIFKPYRDSIRAPHFVIYVQELLEKKYGKEILEKGGLKVFTTLDWKLQEYAEKIILERGEANEKNYKATNAAALFADPKTGHILALVGSRDYFNDEIKGKVDVTNRRRAPGSSFKPIVYAQTFLNRYSPATVIYDTPVKIGSTDEPQNYDGKFYGPITIRRALGQSRNIPAIKAYWMAGEQNAIIDLAKKMGIESLNPNFDYGYPLAIGAGEVKMREMVTAFSVFAANGKKPELTPILKIENIKSEIIEEWDPELPNKFPEVLDPQVAYLVNSILSDDSIKLSQHLTIPKFSVATKTGTSTNKTKSKGAAYPMDLWIMGYTSEIVGAVWIGNSNGDPMTNNADGSIVSAPIWKEIMTKALERKQNTPFTKPEGIKEMTVSSATGLLPGENTPKEKILADVFASFAVPTEVENVFLKKKIDARNNMLTNDFCPQEIVKELTFQDHKDPIDPFGNWGNGIRDWYKNKEGEEFSVAPTKESPLCEEKYAKKSPKIIILFPAAGSQLKPGGIEVGVEIEAQNKIKKVEYFFEDTIKLILNRKPFNKGTIKIPKYAKPGKEYSIKAKVTDQHDYTAEGSVMIKIKEGE